MILKALYTLVSKNLHYQVLKVCFHGEIAALKPKVQSAFSIVSMRVRACMCMHAYVCACTLVCMQGLKDKLPPYLRQSLFVVCSCVLQAGPGVSRGSPLSPSPVLL